MRYSIEHRYVTFKKYMLDFITITKFWCIPDMHIWFLINNAYGTIILNRSTEYSILYFIIKTKNSISLVHHAYWCRLCYVHQGMSVIYASASYWYFICTGGKASTKTSNCPLPLATSAINKKKIFFMGRFHKKLHYRVFSL